MSNVEVTSPQLPLVDTVDGVKIIATIQMTLVLSVGESLRLLFKVLSSTAITLTTTYLLFLIFVLRAFPRMYFFEAALKITSLIL